MKITRVRVKTAVCAIVLSTTGSVMSTVKAPSHYLTPPSRWSLTFIVFIVLFLNREWILRA